MQPQKSKIEKFLKSNPEYKEFCAEIIEKEKEKIQKEEVDYKLIEKLIPKAKTFVDYDVQNTFLFFF